MVVQYLWVLGKNQGPTAICMPIRLDVLAIRGFENGDDLSWRNLPAESALAL